VQAAIADSNASLPADQRIEFRIGIHQGDVVVEDDDIFGAGVNIAARLEGLAEPGGRASRLMRRGSICPKWSRSTPKAFARPGCPRNDRDRRNRQGDVV
jgi:Adenylate and Guanylate cyclase catalytic domain